MKNKTKNQFIAVVVVIIIILIVIWYFKYPKTHYIKLSTLTNISFGPSIIFTFSSPIDVSFIKSSAILKKFIIDPNTPPAIMPSAIAVRNALLANGGVPFIPMIYSSTAIISNSLPHGLINLSTISPISFNGTGVMWFTSIKS